MNKKTKKWIKSELNKANKVMKKEQVNMYVVLFAIFISVLIGAIVFYNVGHNEGYNKRSTEIKNTANSLQLNSIKNALMDKPIEDVYEYFLKYLMVSCILWLPIILVVLGIGWIIHGVL